jgi:adenylylsulfate kinase
MGRVLWITGLPGAGKSTLASLFAARHPEYVLLRMDELRKTATPEADYSPKERDILYRSLVFTAALLSRLGHSVVIDATGHRRLWRELARREIKNFTEVYLKCPVPVCAQREGGRGERAGAPLDIYEKAREGWPVPGINVPYEEPASPELLIDTEKTGPEEALKELEKLLSADSRPVRS